MKYGHKRGNPLYI